MSPAFLMPLARRAGLLCVAAMVLTGAAFASSTASQASPQASAPTPAINFAAGDWSSSLATSQIAEFRPPAASAALPLAPAPSASGGQESNGGGMWHHAASGLA